MKFLQLRSDRLRQIRSAKTYKREALTKMHNGSDKKETRRFAEEAMKRRPDKSSLQDIVYLDEDLHSYKYFLTGEFDEAARKKAILD